MEVINKVGGFTISLINDTSIAVKKAKANHQHTNFNSDLILIDNLGKAIKLGTSDTFDGETEVMTYGDYYKQSYTFDFYGSNAFINASNFIALLRTQSSFDLQRARGLTFYRPAAIEDLQHLVGTTYNNRYQIEIQVGYWINTELDTLRIDTAETSLTYVEE